MPHAPTKPAHFLRNSREIARCFKLRESRKTLAEVGRWLAHPDFPVKTRHGYVREEILAWLPKYLREKQPLDTARALLRGDLSPTEKTLARLESAIAGALPATSVSGQPAIAAIISSTLHMRCQRQDIQKWRAQAPEPFPAPDPGNRFHVAGCLDWVRKWILPGKNGNGQTPDLFQKAALTEAQSTIDAAEHEQWKREIERGQWIKLEQHRRELISSGRRYHQLARKIETEPARQAAGQLREAGLPAEVITRVCDVLRACGIAIISEIERECAALAAHGQQLNGKEKT